MSLAESLPSPELRFASAEAFLDWVERQPEKWELRDGVARRWGDASGGHSMMTGGSVNHGRLGRNAVRALANRLGEGPCEAFGSDVAVIVGPTQVAFPDASVCCEPVDQVGVRNPVVIIEALSPKTESYDLGDKAGAYRKLPSLRHLVFVRQDRIGVQHFHRAEAGEEWRLTEIDRVNVPLRLTAVGVEIGMPELYAQVRFG